MAETIFQLCNRFAKSGISLANTPDLAYGRCWELSLAFSNFCKGAKINARMLSMECAIFPIQTTSSMMKLLQGGIEDAEFHKLAGHYVVWFPKDQQFVDWTARQFWSSKPHPWIGSKVDLERHWGTIEFPN